MKIGQPRAIFNPYDWLPGYGESKVSFHSVGADVVLDIEYEREEPGVNGEALLRLRREIIFKWTSNFIKVPFPGMDIFEFDGASEGFSLGSLTEFIESEMLENNLTFRASLSSGRLPKLRHFNIQFLSENIAFHVLSEDVVLSGEILVEQSLI